MQRRTAPAGGPATWPSSIAAVSANCVVRSARALRLCANLTSIFCWEQSEAENETWSSHARGNQQPQILVVPKTIHRGYGRRRFAGATNNPIDKLIFNSTRPAFAAAPTRLLGMRVLPGVRSA